MNNTTTALILGASLALAQDHIMLQRKISVATDKEPTVMFFSSTGESIKGAPYSADTITETTQVLGDGNRIVRTNKSSFARDGEGRTRRETQIQNFGPLGASKDPVTSTFIEDPIAKFNYTLDSSRKVALKATRGEAKGAMRWQSKSDEAGPENVKDIVIERAVGPLGAGLPAEAGHRIRIQTHVSEAGLPKQGLSNVEQLGERNFEGVLAKGHRVRMKIPAGQVGNERDIEVVTETWLSEELKSVVYSKHSDPRFGETVTRMTNIKLGEPPASLFDVPADYTVENTKNMRMPMPFTVVKD